jgi:hypothetical protein
MRGRIHAHGRPDLFARHALKRGDRLAAMHRKSLLCDVGRASSGFGQKRTLKVNGMPANSPMYYSTIYQNLIVNFR